MRPQKQHAFTFNVAAEYVSEIPTDYLQREVARHFGNLLTEAILDPESDPLAGPITIQARQKFDPMMMLHMVEGRLFCDRALRDVAKIDYAETVRDIHEIAEAAFRADFERDMDALPGVER